MNEAEAKQLAEKLRRLFKVHTRVVWVVRTCFDRRLLGGE